MIKCNMCKQEIKNKKNQFYGRLLDAENKKHSISFRVCKKCMNKLINE